MSTPNYFWKMNDSSSNTTHNTNITNSITITNSTTPKYDCIPRSIGISLIVLALVACPFHLYILKVLIARLRLKLARHKILLSLSIADNLQLLLSAIIFIISIASALQSSSTGCLVIRKIFEFNCIATLVSSSGSIVLLSIERYIACIYALQFHNIVTHKRTVISLLCLWTISITSGVVQIFHVQKPNGNYSTFNVAPSSRMFYIVVVFASSCIISIVQIRLYLLSKSKLKADKEISFGSRQEESDLRRRHIKIAVVSSAVTVLYMICMLPLAVYNSFHFAKDTFDSKLRQVVVSSAILNTLFDPFLYGIGMVDIRRAMKRDWDEFKFFIRNRAGVQNDEMVIRNRAGVQNDEMVGTIEDGKTFQTTQVWDWTMELKGGNRT